MFKENLMNIDLPLFLFFFVIFLSMKKIEGNEIDVQYRLYEKDILIRD